MRPVTERDIRTSFVNCTKGEAKRLAIPKDLASRPWDDLDFLGWRDPAAPDRAYIIAEAPGSTWSGTRPAGSGGSGRSAGLGIGPAESAGSPEWGTGPATSTASGSGSGGSAGSGTWSAEPAAPGTGFAAPAGSVGSTGSVGSGTAFAGSGTGLVRSAGLIGAAGTGTGFVAVALRRAAPTAGRPRRGMCSLCLTAHSGDGVSLMTARKAGRGGQQGNSVGAYMCSDLACSLYLRGKKDTEAGARFVETLTVEEQADRALRNLMAFLAKVIEAPTS